MYWTLYFLKFNQFPVLIGKYYLLFSINRVTRREFDHGRRTQQALSLMLEGRKKKIFSELDFLKNSDKWNVPRLVSTV